MPFMYGYGIMTCDHWATTDNILALLDMAPEYKSEVFSAMEDLLEAKGVASFREMNPADARDALLEILRDEYEEEGIHVILSRVIEEVEGVELTAVTDGDVHFLVLDIRNPWNTPWKVKLLKEDQINEIFRKYINMVTNEEVKIDNYFI